jgi:hypothetical protein
MIKIKNYKRIAQIVILIGGILSIIHCYNSLSLIPDVITWINYFGIKHILRFFFGMLCSGFIVLLAGRPNIPIPFRSILIALLGLVLLYLEIIIGALMILIGSVLKIFDKKNEED